ncbi:hypothetical protein ENBRE01_0348 [Enteropsectra breve]|nr:hypothetical protein ENBRE01_0348 [Enteropsectra breve]
MNKKHFMWIIPSGVLILGLFIYKIRKPSDKESEEQEKTNRPHLDLINRPVTEAQQHNERPRQYNRPQYNEEPADFGTAELIEEKAKTFINDYYSLSTSIKDYVIAQGLILSLMNCSKTILSEDTTFSASFYAGDLVMMHRGFIRNVKGIPAKDVEEEYNAVPKMAESESPIYNIFSFIHKKGIAPWFMVKVGVCAEFDNTKGDNPTFLTCSRMNFQVLNIKETMNGDASSMYLNEYLETIQIPPNERIKNDYGNGVAFTKILDFYDVLLFYSDFADKPSPYMTGSFDLKTNFRSESVYTYKLKSVIIRNGGKDDIYKMKVLKRDEENIEEFVEVANQKGTCYLYERS